MALADPAAKAMQEGTGQPAFTVDTSLPSTGIPGIDSPVMGDSGQLPMLQVPRQSQGGMGTMLPTGQQATGTRGQIIDFARQFLGTPYVWGGTQPGGFDCSGLVQYVYKHFGVSLPRVSYQQSGAGKRISLDQLQPGDLVFWDNSSRNNGADHVAIYIGNGQIIQAPRPGKNVEVSNLYDTGRAWGVSVLG